VKLREGEVIIAVPNQSGASASVFNGMAELEIAMNNPVSPLSVTDNTFYVAKALNIGMAPAKLKIKRPTAPREKKEKPAAKKPKK